MKTTAISLIVLALSVFVTPYAWSQVLFQDDFEDGRLDVGSENPQPVWYWPNNSAVNGPNAWWTITDAVARSGRYALALNYAARNDFANTCGGTTCFQREGYDGHYFVSSVGADFLSEPYIGAGSLIGRFLYDKTKNYTKWRIASVQNQVAINDRLNLILVSPGPGYDATVTISPGDECYIARACGIDGTIGENISRRSDCNDHIIYLGGFDNSTYPWGTKLYRRFYFRFSSNFAKPTSTQKIAYWGTIDGPANDDPYPANKWNGAACLSNFGGTRLGRFDAGNNLGWVIYSGSPFPLQLDRWYYFEEMYKSSSTYGGSDGEYSMWIAPYGEDPGDPKIHLTGLTIAPPGRNIGGVSIWGNKQTTEDMSGYAYIDDIVISTQRIGPVSGDVTPPDVPRSVRVSSP